MYAQIIHDSHVDSLISKHTVMHMVKKKWEREGGGGGLLLWMKGNEEEANSSGLVTTWANEMKEEMKRVCYLAGPLLETSLSQFCPRMISLVLVGDLGEHELSSAAVATSFTNVTGFSLIVSLFQFVILFHCCRWTWYLWWAP